MDHSNYSAEDLLSIQALGIIIRYIIIYSNGNGKIPHFGVQLNKLKCDLSGSEDCLVKNYDSIFSSHENFYKFFMNYPRFKQCYDDGKSIIDYVNMFEFGKESRRALLSNYDEDYLRCIMLNGAFKHNNFNEFLVGFDEVYTVCNSCHISLMENLTELYLYKVSIDRPFNRDAVYIELKHLDNLKSIEVVKCNVKNIKLELRSLESLDLSENYIGEIQLKHCPKLSKVKLCHNPIKYLDVPRCVQDLCITKNPLYDIYMSEDSRLEKLNIWFGGRNLNLTKCKMLKTLNFQDNNYHHVYVYDENIDINRRNNIYIDSIIDSKSTSMMKMTRNVLCVAILAYTINRYFSY